MKLWAIAASAVALFAIPASANDVAKHADEPVQVMVLGMYHFANPGLDAVNMEVDDVLAERRQNEIKTLVNALAQWKPTRIAVENQAAPPSLSLEDYARTEELLQTRRSESVQVGFRLARQLGHDAVYGYDEQPSEGEPDYFPMGKVMAFAQEHGGAELIAELLAEVQATIGAEQEKLPNQSIAESLIFHNMEGEVSAQHDRLYYSLLSIGDGDQQPGAELNAFWYMRNAKMFAKLDMIAEPGDRVLVLAGSGHATWLKHFVRRMPGYEVVDVLPYVKAAAIASAVSDPSD
ncbi:hypothetical protein BPTFM16_00547 [Altererythrobacter insulae]|nr:hypothetical protein BPTFM16_00547 [Altererythrobacter insulae]